MISFRPMKRLMKKRGITQYKLLKEGILLPAHVTRLSYNHNFTLKFIVRIKGENDKHKNSGFHTRHQSFFN